jgi:S-DNA-T family DNA segregation ATPase FtsK/SpoIIIE
MSFKVASVHVSKTIIERVGANRLLGNGDMLMIPPGSSDLIRVHGGYVTETEIARVVNFWKAQGKPQYNEAILRAPDEDENGEKGASDEPYDEFYDQAVEIVAKTRKVSISEIQRKLGVGYNRAAKMVERMEGDGLIGQSQGANKPREVFVKPKDE